MSGRLLYVVGPSGSGKDTVIEHARRMLADDVDLRVARRMITRPVGHGAEQHLAVSEFQFDLLAGAGQFALHWQANGLKYGIGKDLLAWLAEGATVLVTGSRLHVDQAIAAFPYLELVYVTASPDVCRARMLTRNREDEARIAQRLARGADWQPPAGVRVVELTNNESPKLAGQALAQLIEKGFGAWTPQLIDRTRTAPRAHSAAPPRAPSPRRAPRTKVADSLLATRR